MKDKSNTNNNRNGTRWVIANATKLLFTAMGIIAPEQAEDNTSSSSHKSRTYISRYPARYNYWKSAWIDDNCGWIQRRRSVCVYLWTVDLTSSHARP